MAASEPVELVWSPSALRDVEAIHQSLASRSSRAATAAVRAVKAGAERLQDHPEIGAVAEDVDPVGVYRHLVVRPFRIIYRLEGATLRILRVWDSRRNPDDLRIVDLALISGGASSR